MTRLSFLKETVHNKQYCLLMRHVDMCRVNPRVDFAFKRLFGVKENSDLLISLLNAILSPPSPIKEIELLNPYNEKTIFHR